MSMRIGVDVGGTKIDAVLVDARSVIRHRVSQPTRRGMDGVLDGVHDTIRRLLADESVSLSDVSFVGVGVPGVVNATAGIVRHAINLDIHELNLAEELSSRTGLDFAIDNDVNVAALGAAHLLAISAPLGFVNLGTGLAAGIVVDGRVWRGSRGGAGEIGHVPADPSGVQCFCGQRGCLETVASGSAIAGRWPTASMFPALDLFDAADAGDPRAVAIRDSVVEGVASAIRIMVLSTDVEHIVVGGGLSNLGERLHDPILDVFRGWNSNSPFIASLDLPRRLQFLPPGAAPAALGATFLNSDRVV